MATLPDIWVDRGGTFTDCVLREGGALSAIKVRSSDEAPLVGIRALLGLADGAPIPPCDLRVGTTVATNALLERKHANTLLVVDQGFADLLAIDDQTRPRLFVPGAARETPLPTAVLEDPARLAADGSELLPVDADRFRREVAAAAERHGLEAVAIAKLHASKDGRHERALAEALAELGLHVVTSHEVAPSTGLLGRAHTAVADAALTPALRRYVAFLEAELPGSRLRFLKSDGGLVDAAGFRGRDALLSGPAGGVVAVAATARALGEPRLLGLDMGGTSTDVCRFDGEHDRRNESRVGPARVRAPMLAVHTVAAGGGSLVRLVSGADRRAAVGPASAGAIPGPLSYGHPDAREPALTDAALVLGRVRGERFPFELDAERATEALGELARRVDLDTEPFADGLVTLAAATMADALAEVTVARGHDPGDYALAAFGGAAGQYACRVARQLGVRRIVSHPFAGVLSAWGMGAAPQSWHGAHDLGGVGLDEDALVSAAEALAALEAEGRVALDGEAEVLESRPRLVLRYAGTQLGLEVDPAEQTATLAETFGRAHERTFGYRRSRSLELVAARVEVRAAPPAPPFTAAVVEHAEPIEAQLYLPGGWQSVPAWRREALPLDRALAGPLLVMEETGTLVVEPGFTLVRRAMDDVLVLEDGEPSAATDSFFRVEILAQRLAAIAERMGVVLRRSALSTNIRDRLDYSCAIFDGDGALVANAPHIPVHLGAMSASVKAILAAHAEHGLPPGSAYLTNDPAAGGSHLPDLTVVAPVHDADGVLRFFVAARGHHADVGGVTPGSMPACSETLAEEGVVFRGLQVVKDGMLDETAIRAVLEGGPHPARRPDENLADLEAQLAACRRGARELLALAESLGPDAIRADMAAVLDDAEAAVAEAIAELPDGTHGWTETLDDGTTVSVAITVEGGRLHVDFTGTDAATRTNLNAPRAVTEACVLYAIRTLVGRSIPLNDGCMRPVSLTIPVGSLLDPPADAAVAAGNVETSQRVVDAILAALGVMAPSQGTMNNITFGDGTFGYYETLAGGVGGAPNAPGPSATHVHMTNSRITDPELLEARYPVRVRRFAIRRGSGGAGRWPGGDGLVREIEALAPLRVSVLAERRATGARGLAGGGDAAPGVDEVVAVDGSTRAIGGRTELDLRVGETLRIATPGGGGYGSEGSS